MFNVRLSLHRVARFALMLSAGIIPDSQAAQEARIPPSAHDSPASATPPASSSFPPLDGTGATNVAMRLVGSSVFELGKVKLDKKQRTVTFPAVLNMREGMVEYFLVSTYGKTHESIFRTDAEPYHIHLAMLLLDAHGAGTNTPPSGDGGPIERPGMPPIKGDTVALEVSWKVDGKTVRHAADRLVFNQAEHAVMARGTWVYNGSMTMEGMFVAQRDGSIISLISDPYALMNNPRPGSDNDEIWTTQTNRLPEVDTPVEITIKLESGEQKRPANR